LLSGRDPSTFSSTRSTNFAAAAAARSLQQIRMGSDMVIIDKIFINNSIAPAPQILTIDRI
jgi:hypothetical protein